MRTINTCLDCRHWSEMIARCNGTGPVEAMCLNKASRNYMKYTVDRVTCDHWQDGSLGRVDEPGGSPYEQEEHTQEEGEYTIPLYTALPKREWAGLNHFDRTLLRTTYAPLKRLHHIKETNTDIVAEIVNDWDAFFTAIEAKLREKNHG